MIKEFMQVTFFVAAFSCGAASNAERISDPLAPIVACVSNGALKITDIARLPQSTGSRIVQTSDGKRSVTTIDGYRMMLYTQQKKPLVNLKIELSAPESASSDWDAVHAQMQVIAERGPRGPINLQRSLHGDTEILQLHRSEQSLNGPASLYSIFVPAKGIIVTMYLFNQDSAGQTFSNFADYVRQRDSTVGAVMECLPLKS